MIDEKDIVDAKDRLHVVYRIRNRGGAGHEADPAIPDRGADATQSAGSRVRLSAFLVTSGGKRYLPPHDKGDVAAEQAGIDVQLVDDDEPEVAEELSPPFFLREDRDMQHIWVGEDLYGGRGDQSRVTRILVARVYAYHAGVLPDVVAVVPRSVAIEGRDLDIFQSFHCGHELAERALLVLRERLGREDVERCRFRILLERLDHGELVHQRLAGRGRRRDDDVASARVFRTRVQRIDRQCLMRVQPVRFNALRLAQRVRESRRELKIEGAC